MKPPPKSFYCNCLLFCIQWFLKNPLDADIYIMLNFPIPHFYVYCRSKNKYFHFCALNKNLPLYKQFWFKGTIMRFFRYKSEEIASVKLI
jgi:hypothetical protein